MDQPLPGVQARFLLPSLAGVIVFGLPVFLPDKQTIVFGLLTDGLQTLFAPWLFEVLLVVLGVAGIGGLAGKLISRTLAEGPLRAAAFDTGWGWIVLRNLGFAFGLCVYFQVGPEFVHGADTGKMVFNDIGINMLVIFLVGITFMPLLTDYGLLEFVGTLARRVFQIAFRLPGRAVVDATASIVSASSIGLLVTLFQYERGYYNAREASIIACNFSIVSIPFCLLIADVARLQHLFFGWYLSVVSACIFCAAILARIRPLAALPETYLTAPVADDPHAPSGLVGAYAAALQRAAAAPGVAGYLNSVCRNFIATSFGVIGPAMALATLAAIGIFHTPIFEWLTLPIAGLLNGFGILQSTLIAQGFVVGFVDQFMPAIIARSLDAEFWRFVLGGLAVTQLVFLSEFGVLVLRSKLPVGLAALFIVFVQRTLITAPVLLLMAALLTTDLL